MLFHRSTEFQIYKVGRSCDLRDAVLTCFCIFVHVLDNQSAYTSETFVPNQSLRTKLEVSVFTRSIDTEWFRKIKSFSCDLGHVSVWPNFAFSVSVQLRTKFEVCIFSRSGGKEGVQKEYKKLIRRWDTQTVKHVECVCHSDALIHDTVNNVSNHWRCVQWSTVTVHATRPVMLLQRKYLAFVAPSGEWYFSAFQHLWAVISPVSYTHLTLPTILRV